MHRAGDADRSAMHDVNDTRTISLDRPRKAILYVLLCFGCLVASLALADLALLALSRYG